MMKNTMITELVRIEVLPTSTEEQVLAKANRINDFLQNQDGFIDCELVKAMEGNIWYLIYHIENVQKLRAVGEKVRASKLFDELSPIMTRGSMNFSFFNQIKKW
jgi:hypothetical protein